MGGVGRPLALTDASYLHRAASESTEIGGNGPKRRTAEETTRGNSSSDAPAAKREEERCLGKVTWNQRDVQSTNDSISIIGPVVDVNRWESEPLRRDLRSLATRRSKASHSQGLSLSIFIQKTELQRHQPIPQGNLHLNV